MDIDYTVAALMFPAITLMMTMYSNRFHTLSALIRQLHDKYTSEKKVPPELENQLHVLNKTITDLAGSNNIQFNNIDGGSLKEIIYNNKENNVKRNVSGIFFHVPYRNGIALKRPHSAVRKGDYKLIKFQDSGEILLFNVLKDLKEENNLANKSQKIAIELEKILDDYLADVKAPKWREGINWKNKPLNEFNSFH